MNYAMQMQTSLCRFVWCVPDTMSRVSTRMQCRRSIVARQSTPDRLWCTTRSHGGERNWLKYAVVIFVFMFVLNLLKQTLLNFEF